MTHNYNPRRNHKYKHILNQAQECIYLYFAHHPAQTAHQHITIINKTTSQHTEISTYPPEQTGLDRTEPYLVHAPKPLAEVPGAVGVGAGPPPVPRIAVEVALVLLTVCAGENTQALCHA
jgi:hypothetical protein